MTISESQSGDKIQLNLEGRIDVAASTQLQACILTAFQKSIHLILEFSMIEYISSAGLRALLIGQKTANSKGGSMILVNVQPAVKQVFDTTGFTAMLHIE